jgi:hypothetical protein
MLKKRDEIETGRFRNKGALLGVMTNVSTLY